MTYDAAVVGAGPAGSHVAALMAAQGLRVIVLEQSGELGKKACCTGIVSNECLRAFPQLGPAVRQDLSAARIFSPSGSSVRVSRSEPQAHALDRAALDKLLAERARANGAEYALESTVESVSASPTEARLEVRCNGTGTRALHAQVVVLACGFSPSLTARAGLGAIPDFAIGAQARVELKNLAEAELYLGRDVAPGFFAWAVPTGEGEGLVGLLARRGARPRLETLLSRLHEAGKLAAPAGPVLQAPVPLRPLRRSYGPRLLVVGDAAGHVKPTSGGGIYYSLLGAEFAAQTIVRAAGQGDFSRRGLSTYEKLWKKRLAREFRVGHWARRIFERLSDPEIEEILDAVVANGVHETVLRSEQYAFDWHARVILDSLQHPVLGRLLGKAAHAALLAQARRLGTPG